VKRRLLPRRCDRDGVAHERDPRPRALEGLKLGEEVAIRLLEELRFTGNELFSGFSLRRFDGRRVSVG